MDLLDDDDDGIDAAMEQWLIKEAADQGIDLGEDPYGNELELIKSWQQEPTMDGFEQLYNIHAPLINRASSGYMSSNLPKAALKGYGLQRYVHALQTYNPDRGAKFNTYLFREMQRLGRYKAKYSNVARVGSEDLTGGGMISLMQDSITSLTDRLGRQPTDSELADDMLQSTEDVVAMQKTRDKINPKNIGSLRSRLREDNTMEGASIKGVAEIEGESAYRRRAVFLHGSLNSEQQLVLEHTFEGFGKPIIEDDIELAQALNLSPQKIRALKAQIRKKVDKKEGGYY